MVSTRVLFDMEPSRYPARRMERVLVASHMRIAFSIPAHREYMRSGTPSEPILAEAAAVGMDKFKVDAVDVVSQALESGIIDKGTRVELAARLLLIKAYDRALKSLHAREQTWITSYSRAVPVRDFLQALIAESYLPNVLGCKPDGAGDPELPLEQAFEGAFVRFSHFARNGIKNVVDTQAALAAVARGMAIQCCQNQEAVDIVIPIVLKDEKLKEDVMSVMLIQVRDREKRVSHPNIVAESLGIFPRGGQDERPYIVIVMQLGAVVNPKCTWFVDSPCKYQDSEVKQRANVPRPPRNLEPHLASRTHPRYHITIDGCSNKVYGVITEADSPRFAGILAARGIFSEHSRPELDSQVQELKPEWNRNRVCYGWTNQPELWSMSEEDEGIVQETITCGGDATGRW